MNTKLVAALVVILTLLIGVLLGLLGGRLWGPRDPGLRDRPGRFMNEEFVIRRLERAIDPTEAQRDTVHKILEAHASRILELHRQQFEETARLMDTLMLQLDGVLSEEQREHFRVHLQERRPQGGRPDGPPDGPPGPRRP
jgi:hypothetical protein